MQSRQTTSAFTLIEILIVLAVISTLAVLLFPSIQSAREASRRSACQNNLRQVGIAIATFEAEHQRYPIGARRQVTWPSGLTTIGTSWWVEILPHLDESTIASRLDVSGPYAGWVPLHPQNGRLVDGIVIGSMYCPSSSIPQFSIVGGFRVGMASYVGVSGAMSDADFKELRVNPCCAPRIDGEISAGGMLIANTAIQRSEIIDGTSHTLIVGEASDFGISKNGIPHRVDGGFPNGWLAGTFAVGTPPNYDPTRTPAAYNITSVRYAIGTRDSDLPGVFQDHGANNPLLSCHPGGAVVLFVDGSVHFKIEDTEVLVLKRLATRDDHEIGR